ncbi:MAG: TPR repeat-containing protein YrrB [bacterium ADurb.Bin363]|nr:MAG: TPR repeat-containing protein YrrB [bacterium ADurb.Bin363]
MKKRSIFILSMLLLLLPFVLKSEPGQGVDLRVLAISSFDIIPDNLQERTFGTGFADTVITKLSTIEGLRLIERTQLERAKKRLGLGLEEVITEELAFKLGEMLDADIVILGSIQTSRDRFKVSTKTLDMETKEVKVFTSEPISMVEGIKGIENDIEPLNIVHNQIAMNITGEMGVKLDEKQVEIVKKDYTNSGSAYISYARGRDFYVKYTLSDNDKAIEFFTKAIESDPNYALAYASLGDSYAQKVGLSQGKNLDFLEKSIEVSEKALEVDPKLPEGYKSLGLAYTYKGFFMRDEDALSSAIEHYEKALLFNPYYVDVHLNLGRIYLAKGNINKALSMCQRAIELDYGYSLGHIYIGLVYRDMKEYKKALGEFLKALDIEKEMKTPESSIALNAHVLSGMTYVELNNFDKALAEYDLAIKIDPDYPPSHAGLGALYYKKRDKTKAKEEFELYLKLAPDGEFVESVKKMLDEIE